MGESFPLGDPGGAARPTTSAFNPSRFKYPSFTGTFAAHILQHLRKAL